MSGQGIYILKTCKKSIHHQGWVEKCDPYAVYRVAFLPGIENLEYYEREEPYNLGVYLMDNWGRSPVFSTENEAIAFAKKVLKKLKSPVPVTLIPTNYVLYQDA